MMKISEYYRKNKKTFSFEFFPPRTDENELKLYEIVKSLKQLDPSFVSVTYGAMGATRDRTLNIVSKIKSEIGLEVAAHLTCVGHNRQEIEAILGELHQRGVKNIVALRGDPPQGQESYQPVQGGFQYASELVRFIREHPRYGDAFALAVGGYPEGHVECRDKKKDLDHLKIKVDYGADIVITQLFFDNRDYLDFIERARKAGIRVPIVPGIMPVTHGPQIEKFAGMCGARIPEEMHQAILRFADDQASVEAYGIEYATKQCQDLLSHDVPGIHFYTLNRSNATRQIYANLGLHEI